MYVPSITVTQDNEIVFTADAATSRWQDENVGSRIVYSSDVFYLALELAE
jgi:hypothetical protein